MDQSALDPLAAAWLACQGLAHRHHAPGPQHRCRTPAGTRRPTGTWLIVQDPTRPRCSPYCKSRAARAITCFHRTAERRGVRLRAIPLPPGQASRSSTVTRSAPRLIPRSSRSRSPAARLHRLQPLRPGSQGPRLVEDRPGYPGGTARLRLPDNRNGPHGRTRAGRDPGHAPAHHVCPGWSSLDGGLLTTNAWSRRERSR